MTDHSKDLFSTHSECYAKYRPHYPKALFDFILRHVPIKDAALDCGTGNGQAAGALSGHFREIYAIDISEKQIENAIKQPNIFYRVCQVEKTPFADNSFDLVTSATAIHWFRFNSFFEETRRVGKNNGVFACWAYSVLKTNNPAVTGLIQQFYGETIHDYWDPERRHVDEEYKNIPFPFAEIENPGFATRLDWDLQTLEGYLNTWSAVQHYVRKNNKNPVTPLIDQIRRELPPKTVLAITLPIFMRIGLIKK